MDTSSLDASQRHIRMAWRQWLLWGMAALLGLSIWLMLFKLARIGLDGWQVYHNGTAIIQTLRADDDLAALFAHQTELAEVADGLTALEKEIRPLAPLLRRMDGVTAYGSTIAAAPELLVVGAEYATLAAQTVDRIGSDLPAGEVNLEALIQAVGRQGETIAQLSSHADRAAEALSAVDVASLPPRLVEPLSALQLLAPLVGDGLQITSAIPQLLGMNGPVTYLVLVQNNHELRGTGGFISGVGVLTVERGRVTDLSFSDSYAVDNLQVSHPPAPPPLQKYMGAQLLFLRDANWSPDFPTSARTIDTIYTRDKGTKVDGIITIDLRAVELIIGALGSVDVDGIDQPVTGENVVEVIKLLWTNPVGDGTTISDNQGKWWSQRKDFMPLIAQAILTRLRGGRFNYFAMIGAAQKVTEERAIQIWIRDASVETQLHALGWDGSLAPQPNADFVALVDSNLGFNKVDAVMRRSLDYRVYWLDGPNQPATVQATITYEHTQSVPDLDTCVLESRYGKTYDDMTKRCYFDFVRLYTPRGSELISVQGVDADSVISRAAEAGTHVLGAFFTVQPGRTHQVTFTYRLPAYIQQDGYRLVMQRQSGSGPLPVRWQVGERAFTGTMTQNTFVWTGRPQ